MTYERIGSIHDEALNRVMYVPESDVIITSSLSPTTSVVMMDMKKKKKPYIFKVSKVSEIDTWICRENSVKNFCET